MELLKYDGIAFSANISGDVCTGIISVERSRVYLCQNVRNGDEAINKKGFRYSWCVGDGSSLESYGVCSFRILQTFKPDDFVKIKDECKGHYYFGGEGSGVGKIRSLSGSYGGYDFKVTVDLDHNRNGFSMLEKELVKITETEYKSSPIAVGDIVEYHGERWLVQSMLISGLFICNKNYIWRIVDFSEVKYMKVLSHSDWIPNKITHGQYLRINKLRLWSACKEGRSPIGELKDGDCIRVKEVDSMKELDSLNPGENIYVPFTATDKNGVVYGMCLCKQNDYTILTSTPPDWYITSVLDKILVDSPLAMRYVAPGGYMFPAADPFDSPADFMKSKLDIGVDIAPIKKEPDMTFKKVKKFTI